MDIQFTSKKVGEILRKGNLRIPSYQRPYKWDRKHIRNLFYDLQDAMGKREYQVLSLIHIQMCIRDSKYNESKELLLGI